MINTENRAYYDFNILAIPVRVDPLVFDAVDDNCACALEIVTGSNDGFSYMMDYSSAWKKLFTMADTVVFKLYKNNVLSTYQPTAKPFKNDQYSKYCTIDWTAVLNADGEGCYRLEVESMINSETNTEVWREWQLIDFKLDAVERTIRLKAVFNSMQNIEGINFSGENVVDTMRIGGFFGERQPSKIIENQIDLKYQVNRIVRRNSNEYTLETHTISYSVYLKKIIDLYLLSENQLFVSDFNPLNPDKSLLDIAVSIPETEKIDYIRGVEKAVLKVKLEDKIKNQITY